MCIPRDTAGIANVMKAYGKWGICPGEELLTRFEWRVVSLEGKGFSDVQLANVMWSYAGLGIRPGSRMLKVLGDQACAKANKFNAICISNVMWSYAKLGIFPEEGLLDVLEAQAVSLASKGAAEFTGWSVSQIFWAYGTWLKKPPALLVKKLEGLAVSHCQAPDSFDPRSIANMLWAYATLAIRPGGELDHVLKLQTCLRIADFGAQNIANTMWAYATLDMSPGEKLNADIERRATAIAEQLTLRNVSNLLWAYAVLDICPGEELLVRLLCSAVEQLRIGQDSSDDLLEENIEMHMVQLHQFMLSYQLRGWGEGRDNSFFRSLKLEIGHKGLELLSTEPTMSSLQRDVAAALRRFEPESVEEYIDLESGYSIDIFVPPTEDMDMECKGIAVEVDGPHHYLSDGSHFANGATILKKRLLGLLGYRVATVPYWEWEGLHGGREKDQYVSYILGIPLS